MSESFSIIKAVVAVMPAAKLNSLAANNEVSYISPDRDLASASTTTDFYDSALNAPYAWQLGYDGTGIGVAVIDSGINEGTATSTNNDLTVSGSAKLYRAP